MKLKRANFSERLLAFGVAMTMILGMSFPVFADEGKTLNEMIAEADEGAIVTLDKDYIEDVIIPSGTNVILDLAGHTLRGTDTTNTATIKVEKGATLTIKGSGEVINNATGNGASCIFNNGTVVLEDGTIKKETGNKSYYNIANHGNMTINGGTILNDTPYEEGKSHASLVENGYYDYTSTNPVLGYVEEENEANPSLEINGGTFDGGLNTIKNDDAATLVINDAEVKNQIQVAVFNVSEATINGGKFDVPAGNDKTTIFNRRYNDDVNKGKLVVTGGEFNADYFVEVINNATEAQMGEIIISGGTFNTEKGLVNTENRVDITTLKISGGVFAQEPSEEKLVNDVEKFEKAEGEWVVGKKVVLTLKFENGSGDLIENHLSGDEVTLPTTEKEGYELKGWMKDEETIYASGETIKLEEDITLTAKWEEKKEEESGENEPSGDVSGETNHSGEQTENNSGSNHDGKKEDDKKEEENKNEETKEKLIYDDVKENDWFKSCVDKATEMKLVNGLGNKKFAPNEDISRGMLVTILYRYVGAEEKSLTTFDDVSKDAYYAQAISWAQKNNIVKGTGDNKFEPDRSITREELATVIYRFVNLQEKEFNMDSKKALEYADKDEISEFALEAITWCTENGIIQGREEKMMAPKANTTRAEATTMVVRLVELLSK